MEDFKKQYKRERRTTIENGVEAVFEEAKQQELDVYFLLDRFGYAKTIDEATFERNKEAALNENRYVFKCKNTGKVCLFTDKGQLHTIKVMDVPFGKFRDKSVPVDNISTFSMEKENIVYVASQSDLNLYRVMFMTKQAMCKVVDGGEFDVAKRNVAATKLQDGDEVVWVEVLKEQKTIVLQSQEGYFLRMPVEDIPEKKKAAIGVRGMKLKDSDSIEAVFGLNYNDPKTIEYKSKQLELNKIKLGKRDGSGVKVRA